VYYARRSLLGLSDHEEQIDIKINPANLRFMVMTPGGENPRPDVDPSTSALPAAYHTAKKWTRTRPLISPSLAKCSERPFIQFDSIAL
jgi:hypothetical protein